ncbi:MAG: acylglycerol kinase family protein [Candidatus Andeanibacterium colombiense]|uniref:Acylglycerol kinase family protein n=1 Tax=Candidatus Andeanibacterium colombiense TaxID=3121345 RepID=A0AAJ6BR27_9SPHN|nr:MAG: acylglycerol kinase family protein [Sphingomonadaceae bacterium]
MPLIAVLSNPNSSGNRRHLPRIREFCADRGNVMNVEVSNLALLRPALDRIAAARPDVFVINGGDGTIQSVLTELYADDGPDWKLPPIALMPGGRTNVIAKDMGASGDPLRALQRVIAIAETDLDDYLSIRQLISLSTGAGQRPTMGMFLAAGSLADLMLWCRHRLYSLGMPTWIAHVVTLICGVISVLTDWGARFLPPPPAPADVCVGGRKLRGRYQILMVSTLQNLVLWGRTPHGWPGTLSLIALERNRTAVARMVWKGLTGQLARARFPGLNVLPGNEIRFEAGISNVIMDGESFTAGPGETITLKPVPGVRFVDLRSRVRVTEPMADEAPAYGASRPEAAGVSRMTDVLSDARIQSRKL